MLLDETGEPFSCIGNLFVQARGHFGQQVFLFGFRTLDFTLQPIQVGRLQLINGRFDGPQPLLHLGYLTNHADEFRGNVIPFDRVGTAFPFAQDLS